MARPPKKPQVSYIWTEHDRGSDKVQAMCRLCFGCFYSYSRNGIYPSTAHHKTTCPKVSEWREQMRALGLYAH